LTNDEKLTVLRAMVGGSDDDSVLSTYLSLSGAKIIARVFPYRGDIIEVPAQYEFLQLEISAYLLNKRGGEGEISHSENGIARAWENADIPVSMLKAITPTVGVL
jgi:hypothetical protein